MTVEASFEQDSLTIALISDVFSDKAGPNRLREHLRVAKDRGAELALLPELPLNPWSPATTNRREDDGEPPGGPRQQIQRDAAAEVGIGLIGGAIIIDPDTGRRYNTALAINSTGEVQATWRKSHIPEEPGFWETSHYEGGLAYPTPISGFGMPIGIQICSDINRPEGTHILSAAGALAVLNPRATELATYDRWRTVFRANALTSAIYVLSVNRPRPEQDVLLGGASVCVAPNGDFIIETTDTIAVATIERKMIDEARIAYPGYLPVRADVYAAGWSSIAEARAAVGNPMA